MLNQAISKKMVSCHKKTIQAEWSFFIKMLLMFYLVRLLILIDNLLVFHVGDFCRITHGAFI